MNKATLVHEAILVSKALQVHAETLVQLVPQGQSESPAEMVKTRVPQDGRA